VIVVRARPSPTVDELPVKEPPTPTATTPASLTLRATTNVPIVPIVLIVVIVVSSVRSGLREGWNDGQSEDDGGNEDGFAKNVASRRVGEL
jgi:hypothetical protein